MAALDRKANASTANILSASFIPNSPLRMQTDNAAAVPVIAIAAHDFEALPEKVSAPRLGLTDTASASNDGLDGQPTGS